MSASTFRIREDELPPELILSIERILDIHTTPDSDPLDKLTTDFNPIATINDYFPDGVLSVEVQDTSDISFLTRAYRECARTTRGRSSQTGTERT